MKKLIYNAARWLRNRRMLPWFVWSFIYDHTSKAASDKWAGERWRKKR